MPTSLELSQERILDQQDKKLQKLLAKALVDSVSWNSATDNVPVLGINFDTEV